MLRLKSIHASKRGQDGQPHTSRRVQCTTIILNEQDTIYAGRLTCPNGHVLVLNKSDSIVFLTRQIFCRGVLPYSVTLPWHPYWSCHVSSILCKNWWSFQYRCRLTSIVYQLKSVSWPSNVYNGNTHMLKNGCYIELGPRLSGTAWSSSISSHEFRWIFRAHFMKNSNDTKHRALIMQADYLWVNT